MLKTLSFDKGYLDIDRDTLKNTARYELAKGGRRPNAPVEHFELLDNLEKMVLTHTGVQVMPEPITIEENQSLRLLWNGAKDACPVENYLIQRMTTKLNINFPDDDAQNMTIGVSYSEKGIQVAFGVNVRVCTNLSVFGDNYFSTWGKDDKLPFSKGMELFEKWIMNTAELRARNYEIIEQLKKINVKQSEVERIFGKLIKDAVMWNAGEKNIRSPFNVSQVHRMIEQGYADKGDVTAWSIANWGTEVIKARTAYTPELIEVNALWNNFLLKNFDINLN